MPDVATWAAVLYGAGVLIGLARVDASPAGKLGLALIWPLGPLTFLLTLAVLFGASLIAFPLFGAAVLLAAVAYSVLSV